MSAPEFSVAGLSKSYLGHPALKEISLTIERGSMNFLLGSNGSGKSSLMSCLAGHQYWDKGEIFRRGESRKKDSDDFNQGLHFISEDITPPMASLAELREIYRSVYPKWNDEIFQRLLSLARLDLSKNLTVVSRGQRVQGLMALTLAAEPETLLLDEVTAVLDPFIRHRLITELEQVNRQLGTTVLIATNIATELKGVRGRLLIMRDGQIQVDRDADHVADGLIKIRIESTDSARAQTSGFHLIDRNDDGSLTLIGPKEKIGSIGIAFQEDKRAITIDQVFIHHTERQSA